MSIGRSLEGRPEGFDDVGAVGRDDSDDTLGIETLEGERGMTLPKRERERILDDVRFELLPRAFTRLGIEVRRGALVLFLVGVALAAGGVLFVWLAARHRADLQLGLAALLPAREAAP